MVERLREFASQQKFHKLGLMALVRRLDKDEMERFRKTALKAETGAEEEKLGEKTEEETKKESSKRVLTSRRGSLDGFMSRSSILPRAEEFTHHTKARALRLA